MTAVVTVASLVSILVLLIMCASLCPRRRSGSHAMVSTDFCLSFLWNFCQVGALY